MHSLSPRAMHLASIAMPGEFIGSHNATEQCEVDAMNELNSPSHGDNRASKRRAWVESIERMAGNKKLVDRAELLDRDSALRAFASARQARRSGTGHFL